MSKSISRTTARKRRHIRCRKRLLGTADRPRLIVTKSLRNISVQCIDDTEGKTVCSASTMDKAFPGNNLEIRKNSAAMAKLAEYLLERLKEKGVTALRFDRNGYRYHGKLRLLADKLREAGIKL
jgi:large subunit ribosomal protein L18